MNRQVMPIDPRLLEDDPDWQFDSEAESPCEEEKHLGYNPQLGDHRTYDPDLYHDRKENRQNLRRRFEHIFAKYERDFDGVGDEIDLSTGDIVVNNGHVQNMRHEGDTGARSLQGSCRTHQVTEHDEAVTVNGGGIFDNTFPGDSALNDGSLSSQYSDPPTPESGNLSDIGGGNDSATSFLEPDELSLNAMDTAAQGSRRPVPAPHAQKKRLSTTTFARTSKHAGLLDMFHQMPGLEESIQQFHLLSKAGRPIDRDDIQSLGGNIANQVCQYFSRAIARSPTSPRLLNTASSAWTYPVLPGEGQEKRKPRSRKRNSKRLPPLLSPTRQSLWAPVRHPVPRKHKGEARRQEANPRECGEARSDFDFSDADAHNLSAEISEHQSVNDAARVCRNCSYTGNTTWRLGLEKEDLCNACGMYLYRYGLHRPTEPFFESEPDETSDSSGLENDDLITSGAGSNNENRFSATEDSLLLQLKEVELLSWPKIARHFPNRSPYSIQCRYSKFLAGRPSEARDSLIEKGYVFHRDTNGSYIIPRPRASFTEDDDDLLLKLRDENELDWPDIALKIRGHGPDALEKRYHSIAKEYACKEDSDPFAIDVRPLRKKFRRTKRKSLQYTKDEDVRLVRLREEEKLPWVDLAAHFPGRTFASLQKRYKRDLRPSTKQPVDPESTYSTKSFVTGQKTPDISRTSGAEEAYEPEDDTSGPQAPSGICDEAQHVADPVSTINTFGKNTSPHSAGQESPRWRIDDGTQHAESPMYTGKTSDPTTQPRSTEQGRTRGTSCLDLDQEKESSGNEAFNPSVLLRSAAKSSPKKAKNPGLDNELGKEHVQLIRRSRRTTRDGNVGVCKHASATSRERKPDRDLVADTEIGKEAIEEVQHDLKTLVIKAMQRQPRESLSILQIRKAIRETISSLAFSKDEMRTELADTTMFEEVGESKTRRWRLIESIGVESDASSASNDDDVIVVGPIRPRQDLAGDPPSQSVPNMVDSNAENEAAQPDIGLSLEFREKGSSATLHDAVTPDAHDLTQQIPGIPASKTDLEERTNRMTNQPPKTLPNRRTSRSHTSIRKQTGLLDSPLDAEAEKVTRKRKVAREPMDVRKRKRSNRITSHGDPDLSKTLETEEGDIERIESSAEIPDSQPDNTISDGNSESANGMQFSPSATGPWSGLRSRKNKRDAAVKLSASPTAYERISNLVMTNVPDTDGEDECGVLQRVHRPSEEPVHPAEDHTNLLSDSIATRGGNTLKETSEEERGHVPHQPLPAAKVEPFSRVRDHHNKVPESDRQTSQTGKAAVKPKRDETNHLSAGKVDCSRSTSEATALGEKVQREIRQPSRTKRALLTRRQPIQGARPASMPRRPRPGASKGVQFRQKAVTKRHFPSAKSVLRFIIDDNSDDELTRIEL